MSSDPGPDPVTPDDAEAGIDAALPDPGSDESIDVAPTEAPDETTQAIDAGPEPAATAGVTTAVPTAAVSAARGTTGGGRGTAGKPTTPGTPDDQPYIDDPVSKVWVGVMIGVFGLILAYALLFGHGGLLTPKPTPEPTLAPSASPSVAPSASAGASPSVAPSASVAPSVSPTAGASASPSTDSDLLGRGVQPEPGAIDCPKC